MTFNKFVYWSFNYNWSHVSTDISKTIIFLRNTSTSFFQVLTRDELNKLRSTPSYEIDAKLLSIRRVRLRHLKSVKGAADDTEAGERMLDFKELQNLLLQDAVPLKLLPLIRSDNKSLSEQLEEAAVSVLAAIQERQEEQSEGLLQSLGEMGVGELSEVCASVVAVIIVS